MILCADVGATKTLLGLATSEQPGQVQVIASQRFLAADVPGFEAMLQSFLRDHHAPLNQPLTAACFGVAGPVENGAVQMTNLPWRLDARALSAQLGGIPVELANDFKAAASGIDVLAPDALMTLQEGSAAPGAPQLVIGAGSGLGVAFRFWRGDHYEVVPGEGGHFGFAPINDEQDRAAERLRPHVARVVVEHFVSGPGLVNFYTYLDEATDKRVSKHGHDQTNGVTGEDVFRLATEEGDSHALHALHHFLLAYGVVAGDYALATLARGGVFLAGGIAQRCGELMRDGRFLVGFRQKGPYAELVGTFPVKVVMEPNLGLLGAAVLGSHLRSGSPA